MSIISDIRRAMRPAQLEPDESKALFSSIAMMLRSAPRTSHLQPVDVPAVTAAGRSYVLKLYLRGGVIRRFTVDHDPDPDCPAMVRYREQRAEWEAEQDA